MARIDWDLHRAKFKEANRKGKVSLAEYCQNAGLALPSAKRNIKAREVMAELKAEQEGAAPGRKKVSKGSSAKVSKGSPEKGSKGSSSKAGKGAAKPRRNRLRMREAPAEAAVAIREAMAPNGENAVPFSSPWEGVIHVPGSYTSLATIWKERPDLVESVAALPATSSHPELLQARALLNLKLEIFQEALTFIDNEPPPPPPSPGEPAQYQAPKEVRRMQLVAGVSEGVAKLATAIQRMTRAQYDQNMALHTANPHSRAYVVERTAALMKEFSASQGTEEPVMPLDMAWRFESEGLPLPYTLQAMVDKQVQELQLATVNDDGVDDEELDRLAREYASQEEIANTEVWRRERMAMIERLTNEEAATQQSDEWQDAGEDAGAALPGDQGEDLFEDVPADVAPGFLDDGV